MKLFIYTLFVILTVPAFAAPVIRCKKLNENSGHGYAAIIFNNKAAIFFKTTKLADLRLIESSNIPPEHADMQSVLHFNQNIPNGYELTLATGGVAGIVTAIVYRGGVAGLTPQAYLNDCR